jgi:hypothetical protein
MGKGSGNKVSKRVPPPVKVVLPRTGLGRSSLEAYASIGIAVITVVFPMNFYQKTALLLILLSLLIDIVWRSDKTIHQGIGFKMGLTFAVTAVLIGLSFQPMDAQFQAEYDIAENRDFIAGVGPVLPYTIDAKTFPPKVVSGQPMTRMTVDGRLLDRYKGKYRLIAGVLHWLPPNPLEDQTGISKSSVFDIQAEYIRIPIVFNDQFIMEVVNGSYSESYVLLAVPPNLSPEQFDSIREAEKLGAKLIARGAMIHKPTVPTPIGPDASEGSEILKGT